MMCKSLEDFLAVGGDDDATRQPRGRGGSQLQDQERERKDVGILDVEGDLEYEIEGVGHLEHKIEVDLEVEGDIEVEGDGDLEDDDKGDVVSEGEHVFFFAMSSFT
jgi:hypothetical protein